MAEKYQHPVYSPVNYLVVDWGFDMCSLPGPTPCPDDTEPEPLECVPLPIREAIDTYTWEQWLPEVIVGIEEPDEEIAANYIRLAAIEFSRRARVLQREIVIRMERGVHTYPVFPWPEERIVGVLGMRVEDQSGCQCACTCSGETAWSAFGKSYRLDVRRKELTVYSEAGSGYTSGASQQPTLLRVLVWAVPTETACDHDVFLYDEFHETVSAMARLKYVQAVHFRDRALVNSLTPMAQLSVDILSAKRRAVRSNPDRRQAAGSGMWQRVGGRGFRPW